MPERDRPAAPTGPRLFDLAQANALVPMLQQRFTEIRGWLGRMQALTTIIDTRETGEATRAAAVQERSAFIERVEQAVHALVELGVEVKAADGLVDLRALREGRQVFLCWQYGEEEFRYWHELDAGFAGRQRIFSPAEFAPAYVS